MKHLVERSVVNEIILHASIMFVPDGVSDGFVFIHTSFYSMFHFKQDDKSSRDAACYIRGGPVYKLTIRQIIKRCGMLY
jgi:hypothetical protein